jgi:NAD(P)H dehydrogenase (quinone)
MTNVLIAYQSFTGSCKALAEAAAKGVGEAGGKADIKDVAAASVADLVAHDALVLVTTQPFQSLAGESKKFFERIWPDREKIKKDLTFAAIICHVNEASSTAATLDMFAKYFGWKKFGDWLQPSPREPEAGKNAARELGIAVAQGG